MREAVGIFDVSHLGKAIGRAGRARRRSSTRRLTNDLGRIGPGKAQYTLCCDDATGGVVDDLIAYLHGRRRRASWSPTPPTPPRCVRRLADGGARRASTVDDQHRDYARARRAGPALATRCSTRLGLPTGPRLHVLRRGRLSTAPPVVVCRTGYTGERGYELVAAQRRRRRAVGRAARGRRRRTACCRAASAPATRCAPRWATRCTARTSRLDITPGPGPPRLGGRLEEAGVLGPGRAARREGGRARRGCCGACAATGRGIPRPGMAVLDAGRRAGRRGHQRDVLPDPEAGIAPGAARPRPASPRATRWSVDVRGRPLRVPRREAAVRALPRALTGRDPINSDVRRFRVAGGATVFCMSAQFSRTAHPAPLPHAQRAEIVAGARVRQVLHRPHGHDPLDPGPGLARRGGAAVRPAHAATRRRWCCTTGRRSSKGSRPTASPTARSPRSGPDANAARFRASAARLAMAQLPDELFLASLAELLDVDREWVPPAGGEEAMYLRPFMMAAEVGLGVRPSAEYLYCVIASPAGPYFPGGVKPVDVWLSTDYTRAALGRHRHGQVRRQLRRLAAPAGPGRRARLRAGGLPRRRGAPLDRRDGLEQPVLRLRLGRPGRGRDARADRQHPRRASPATRCWCWPRSWAARSPSAASPGTSGARARRTAGSPRSSAAARRRWSPRSAGSGTTAARS